MERLHRLGHRQPVAVKALNQLAVSDKITAQTRAQVADLFLKCIKSRAHCTAEDRSSLPRAF